MDAPTPEWYIQAEATMWSWGLLGLACSNPPDASSDPNDRDTEPPPDETAPDTTAPIEFVGAVPRNVIIVTVDTMRWDHIGRYAGTSRTPRLDEFLAESVVLDSHRACSNWTGPAMVCLTTGKTSAAAGFWPLSTDPAVPDAPPLDWETFASRVTDAGWSTALLTANYTYGPGTGIHKGYVTVQSDQWIVGDQLSENALDAAGVLLADPTTPWLLHVHYADPHGPYCPPPEYLETEGLPDFDGDLCTDFEDLRIEYWSQTTEWKAAYAAWATAYYAGEIAYWDVAFGKLIDGLEVMGALDDTLVLFATDHGEQLGERNAWGHGILMGPEETRAGAALWARNLPPVAWTGTTFHSDVAATLYDLYGVTSTEPLEGVFIGTAASDRAVPIWNIGSGIRFSEYADEWGGTAEAYLSVVRGDLQLEYDWEGNRALYDLATDPNATTNVYDPTRPEVIEMWTTMSEAILDISSVFVNLSDPVDPQP